MIHLVEMVHFARLLHLGLAGTLEHRTSLNDRLGQLINLVQLNQADSLASL